MTDTTYPNGQVLASSALTDQQMNIIMQAQTCGMLGINPVDPSLVRVDWQPQGQPDIALPSQDSCYVTSTLEDVDYSKIRDRDASGTGPVLQTWNYTRGLPTAYTIASTALTLNAAPTINIYVTWSITVMVGQSDSDILQYKDERYRVLQVYRDDGGGYWKAVATRMAAS